MVAPRSENAGHRPAAGAVDRRERATLLPEQRRTDGAERAPSEWDRARADRAALVEFLPVQARTALAAPAGLRPHARISDQPPDPIVCRRTACSGDARHRADFLASATVAGGSGS